MDREILKKIIGLAFKKGKKDFPEIKNKTKLSKKIVEHSMFNNTLGDKSLLNYFNYYFLNTGKEITPTKDTIDALLTYLNFQSYKQFIENTPDINYKTDIPFIDTKNKDVDTDEEETKDKKDILEGLKTKTTTYPLALVVVLGIIALVSIVAISIHNKSKELPQTTTSPPTITINTEHFIVSDMHRVFPNHSTTFFNENNEPQVWYTNYKGQQEFYNTMGMHPQSKQPLKPITKEIVKTIYVETPKLETNAPKTAPTNNDKKPYLLNAALKNNSNKKQLSVFIMDSTHKLAIEATQSIKEFQKKKGYSITAPLIASNNLNADVITNLQALNADYFKADLHKFTDYICIGSVSYKFSQNSKNKDLKVCDVLLDYTIIATATGEDIETFSKHISGTGFSKTAAKQNALYKLTLQ